jgi:preprotein translocase subunit SecE
VVATVVVPVSKASGVGGMKNPVEFAREVRVEVDKVTWPTWRETMITTVLVLIMVVLAALFFLAADQVMSRAVAFILGLGR